MARSDLPQGWKSRTFTVLIHLPNLSVPFSYLNVNAFYIDRRIVGWVVFVGLFGFFLLCSFASLLPTKGCSFPGPAQFVDPPCRLCPPPPTPLKSKHSCLLAFRMDRPSDIFRIPIGQFGLNPSPGIRKKSHFPFIRRCNSDI